MKKECGITGRKMEDCDPDTCEATECPGPEGAYPKIPPIIIRLELHIDSRGAVYKIPPQEGVVLPSQRPLKVQMHTTVHCARAERLGTCEKVKCRFKEHGCPKSKLPIVIDAELQNKREG